MNQNKKNKIHFIIKLSSVLPAALLLSVIFGFSAQTGEESGSLSLEISLFLAKLFSPFFPAMQQDGELLAHAETIHSLVRKLAHVTEYFLLTLSLFLPLHVFLKNKYSFLFRLIATVTLSVLFAALDEFHQTLVAGRHGCISDVGIDSLGILLAALLLSLCHQFHKTKKLTQFPNK